MPGAHRPIGFLSHLGEVVAAPDAWASNDEAADFADRSFDEDFKPGGAGETASMLLLDAPALLGVFFSSFPLGAQARVEIADLANEVWVCPASAYEIEWKRRIGKLQAPAVADLEASLISRGYLIAALTLTHFTAAANLPMHHRDPWDRLPIAQAAAENLTIVSPDRGLPAYGVPTIW